MEQFKKCIQIEHSISRHHSLIPYLDRNSESEGSLNMTSKYIDTKTFSPNGNWGQFPYDIDISKFEEYNDLINYFEEFKVNGKYRIPFNILSHKFYCMMEVIRNATYYKSIKKGRESFKWVEADISFYEKIKNSEILFLTDLPNVSEENKIVGVYTDNYFNENGGYDMLSFLMRAMGMFVIDEKYIKSDNGVPEIMYYTGIKPYLEAMYKVKDSKNCCDNKNYEFLGGLSFYLYLNIQHTKIDDEILFWFQGLYREKDEYGIDIIPDPCLNLALVITSETNVIGNFDTVENTTIRKNSEKYKVREVIDESNLHFLRKSKVTYGENEKGEPIELPFIIDYNEENKEYEIISPFKEGYAVNFNGEYGDMIYHLEERDDYYYIFYVIGGEIKKNNKSYQYVDFKEDNIDDVDALQNIFSKFLEDPLNVDLTPERYLFIKNELSNKEKYPDGVKFKGDVMDYSEIKNKVSQGETWIYRLAYSGKYNDKNCYYGDYVILKEGQNFLFNIDLLPDNESITGIRFFEKIPVSAYNVPENVTYNIINENGDEENLLASILTEDNGKYIDITKTNDVNGVFCGYDINEEYPLIMSDYGIGKIDMSVSNMSDVLIDRGFVTMYELHYKLGEINTMEDMENYGNNFFGF